MAFRRYATAIFVFVIVAGGAFTMFLVADAGADSAAQEPVNVTDESISQQVGLWQYVNVALNESTAGFEDSVTVRNSSGGNLTEGEDYEWNASDGSISYLSSPNVTDGSTGEIDYTYYENTQEVSVLSGIIGPIVSLVGYSGWFVGGLALVVVLLSFAAFMARVFGGNDFTSNR